VREMADAEAGVSSFSLLLVSSGGAEFDEGKGGGGEKSDCKGERGGTGRGENRKTSAVGHGGRLFLDGKGGQKKRGRGMAVNT